MRVMFENVDAYVYFIQMENGPIKIGRAKDPYRRLIDLQVGSPYGLHLLYFFPGGAKSEAETKRTLTNEKIRGEWFWPTARVLREIESEAKLDKKNNWSMDKWNPDIDLKDQRLESIELTEGG